MRQCTIYPVAFPKRGQRQTFQYAQTLRRYLATGKSLDPHSTVQTASAETLQTEYDNCKEFNGLTFTPNPANTPTTPSVTETPATQNASPENEAGYLRTGRENHPSAPQRREGEGALLHLPQLALGRKRELA